MLSGLFLCIAVAFPRAESTGTDESVPLVRAESWQRSGKGEVTFAGRDTLGGRAYLRLDLCGDASFRLQVARTETEFEAPPDGVRSRPTRVSEARGQVETTTDALRISVRMSPLGLAIWDSHGRSIATTLEGRAFALGPIRTAQTNAPAGSGSATLRLHMASKEGFYGCGAQTAALDHAGQIIPLGEGGSGRELAHPVPFFMSSGGWGIHLLTQGDAEADFGATRQGEVAIICRSTKLDLYFIAGAHFADILERNIVLTGRPPVPPDLAVPWLPLAQAQAPQAEGTEGLSGGVWLQAAGWDYGDIRKAIRAGLSLGLSGVPFWGCESGGAMAPELRLRWLQFQTFCPLVAPSEAPAGPLSAPGDETASARPFLSDLRGNLRPYIAAAASRASRRGQPLARALAYDCPNGSRCARTEDEYLFGDDLLVAPMVTSGFARSVYLPEGPWLDFWESHTFAGGGDAIVQPPPWGLPLFIRGGSIIPMKLNEGLEVGGGASDRMLLVFNVDARAGGRALVFESGSVITARYERKADRVEVQVDECPEPYGVRVRCGDPLRMTLPRGETLKQVTGREPLARERAAWCYEFGEQCVLAKFPDGRERSVVLEGAGEPIEFAGWSAPDQVRASAATIRMRVTTRGLPTGARARLEYGIAGRKLSLTAEGKPTGGGAFEFRVPVPAEAATSPTPTDLRYRAVLMTDGGELPSAERIVRIVPRG